MEKTYRITWSITNPAIGEVISNAHILCEADSYFEAYLWAEYKIKQKLISLFPYIWEIEKKKAHEIVTEAKEWNQILNEDSILSERLSKYIKFDVTELHHEY